ncbi:MAG TPA: hypothetical protein VGE07_13185 [Herpetosiphonaceae bacterium]
MTDAGPAPSESADAAALPPPSGIGGLIWSLLFLGAGLALALALLSLDSMFLLWGAWLLVGLGAIVRALLWALAWRRPLLWASLVLRVLAPLLAFGVASSDLPLRLDEWRTREVRERLAPGLLDSGSGSRDVPDWPYGTIEIIDYRADNYVFFGRSARHLLGSDGYAYAPAGDLADCPSGRMVAKQRLSERWFWVECIN